MGKRGGWAGVSKWAGRTWPIDGSAKPTHPWEGCAPHLPGLMASPHPGLSMMTPGSSAWRSRKHLQDGHPWQGASPPVPLAMPDPRPHPHPFFCDPRYSPQLTVAAFPEGTAVTLLSS